MGTSCSRLSHADVRTPTAPHARGSANCISPSNQGEAQSIGAHNTEKMHNHQRTTASAGENITPETKPILSNVENSPENLPLNSSPQGPVSQNESLFPLTDDEDECPICLDGYDEENRQRFLECTHHFHLSCVWKWVMYSHYCPVCHKAMKLCEPSI